jgi:release factor glutamine methyltransferase
MSGEAWTVRRLIEWTTGFFTRKEIDSPRLSAELLLAHVLSIPRIKIYTDYERILNESQLAGYRALVQRAVEHEPIAYLTGRAHFFHLEFELTPNLLIPLPDTETLVENVLQQVRHEPGLESPRVLDLCTGSGCIAAAIAHQLKGAIVLATDISEKAVEVARHNIERLQLADRVQVEQGDLFEPLSRMVDVHPFDLIVANPPYIASSAIPELDKTIRDFEPMQALDGGLDGMLFHRKILEQAPDHLAAHGRVYLEIAFDQANLAREIASQHEVFEEIRVLKDFAGNDRVLALRRKS